MTSYQKMSFEDSMKIEEFKRVYKMAMNPDNDLSINKVVHIQKLIGCLIGLFYMDKNGRWSRKKQN